MRTQTLRSWLTASVIVLALIAVPYAAGYAVATQARPAESAPADVTQEQMESELQVFWEAWAVVDRYFVDPQKLDTQQMVYGATRGMVEALGDPHTAFSDPKRNAAQRQDLEGRYEGIGATMALQDGRLVVISPMAGSPSSQSGLMPGDVVLRIDGTDASPLSLSEAVALIRGPQGTTVRLTVQRPGETSPRELVIVRAQIRTETVRTATLRGGVRYIKLSAFRQGASTQLAEALRQMPDLATAGLILDLRDNPGGLLVQAVDVTSQFLAEGVVATEEDGDGGRQVFRARKGGLATNVPMVVLVNQGSASASEIVAGALQDHGRAVLIGETTYGKGSVQQVRDLSDGSGLRVTIARWLTPSGRHIHGVGLEPDKLIEPAEGGDVDRALERAVMYLIAQRHEPNE